LKIDAKKNSLRPRIVDRRLFMFAAMFGEVLATPEAKEARVRLAQAIRNAGARPKLIERLAVAVEENKGAVEVLEEIEGAEEFKASIIALLERPETMRVVMRAARKAALGGV
jgi:hypothetical protein